MEAYEFPVIQRVLIGSRAHGLARPDSDFDYREVFVIPTRHLLSVPLRDRPKTAWSAENKHTDDEAGWEVAKLLEMVMQGHPNAVEVMFAPIEEEDADGASLRELRPALLCSGTFLRSTLGYAQNCRNKLISKNQAAREVKWKATYLRVLHAGRDFLLTGEMPIRVDERPWGPLVRRALANEVSTGEVIDIGLELEEEMSHLKGVVVPESADTSTVNEWLMELRRRRWED